MPYLPLFFLSLFRESLTETQATEAFAAEFISRYGEMHPVFFLGTLEDAIKNSCAGEPYSTGHFAKQD